MTARPRLFLQFILATILLSISTDVVLGDNFPGNKPNRSVLKTQKKVDSLFEKGDYERAIFIYREELAPLGDKYAQYMIGYMHLTGKGVPGDMAVASAWYRLAAERGDNHFEQARDEIWGALSEQQRAQSDLAYIGLRTDYGDAMLVANFIDRDLKVLDERVMLFSMARAADREYYSTPREAKQYAELIGQIETRLQYLTEMLMSGRLDAEGAVRRYEQLDARATYLIKAYEAGK